MDAELEAMFREIPLGEPDENMPDTSGLEQSKVLMIEPVEPVNCSLCDGYCGQQEIWLCIDCMTQILKLSLRYREIIATGSRDARNSFIADNGADKYMVMISLHYQNEDPMICVDY